MKRNFKVIAFDADDTLWVNETYFYEAEKEFCNLLSEFKSPDTVSRNLYRTEMRNNSLYGYGIKGFTLSMLETAARICGEGFNKQIADYILNTGKEMLKKPVVLLKGVAETLEILKRSGYKLVLATKGDLTDQKRKLEQSGLKHYFSHVEVMNSKHIDEYTELLKKLDTKPQDFLMVGNSLVSDIIPLICLDCSAVYIPFLHTWKHEWTDTEPVSENYIKLNNIKQLTELFEI